MTYQARLANGHVEVVTPGGEVNPLNGQMVSQLAAETSRPLTLREIEGANFDDSPVLVVNLATVKAFGVQAGMHVDHRRFRANLYVDGFEPAEEAEWLGRRISVGEVELEAVKQCDRCVVITRDPDTTVTTPEPVAGAHRDPSDLHGRLLQGHAARKCCCRRPSQRGVGNLVAVGSGLRTRRRTHGGPGFLD